MRTVMKTVTNLTAGGDETLIYNADGLAQVTWDHLTVNYTMPGTNGVPDIDSSIIMTGKGATEYGAAKGVLTYQNAKFDTDVRVLLNGSELGTVPMDQNTFGTSAFKVDTDYVCTKETLTITPRLGFSVAPQVFGRVK